MVKQKILDVLDGYQLASLATVTGEGKPWTRYVMIRTDPDLTVRVATFLASNKVKQIRATPEVHINCGVGDLESARHFVQIEGRATVTTDARERSAIWSEGLKRYFSGPDDPQFAVIVVKPYRIEYHSLGERQPQVWES
jgi:general stress protein 26